MKENRFLIKEKKFSINQKAFSLVEVLLAIVLLAIIATPILSVLYSSMSMNIKSRELMAATDVTTGILECIENTDAESFKNACVNKNFNKYPFLKKVYISGSSTCSVSGNTITFQDLKYKKNNGGGIYYLFDVKVYLTDAGHDASDYYYIKNVKIEVYKNNGAGETPFDTGVLSNIDGSVINVD